MRASFLFLLVVAIGGCGRTLPDAAPPDMAPTPATPAADPAVPDPASSCAHWWECQRSPADLAPPADLSPFPGCGQLGNAPCPGDVCAPGLVVLYSDAPSQYECVEPRTETCAQVPPGCGAVDEPPCGNGCFAGLHVGITPVMTDAGRYSCQPCP